MLEQTTTPKLMEDPTAQHMDVPWRKLQPVESPCRSRLLAGTVAYGEKPTQNQVFPQELQLWGSTGAVNSWSTELCGKNICWSSSWRTLVQKKDSRWSRGKLWGRSSRNCSKLTAVPISRPTCTALGKEGRRVGNEAEPEKGRVRRKLVLVLSLFLTILLLFLIVNKFK